MMDLFLVLFGITLLVKSAGVFVGQASALAKHFGLNDFVIGLTIVAFGTSLPELTSTLIAVNAGHSDLAVANIIGSNITNLCLVFGLIALFNRYQIKKRDVDLNIPLNLAGLMSFWVFLVWDNFVIRWTVSVSLILIFVALILLSKEYNHAPETNYKYVKPNVWLLLGSLIVLIGGSRITIDAIVNLAGELGMAETLLGYFLLAVGTSLPELITTWVSIKKQAGEIGMGNILGSNLFNLLFVLSLGGIMRPINMVQFQTDLIFLSMATLLVYFFSIFGKKYSFSRREGLGLLVVYGLFFLMQITK